MGGEKESEKTKNQPTISQPPHLEGEKKIKEQVSKIFHRNCHTFSFFLVLCAQMRWVTSMKENGWTFYICSRVEKREKAMPT